MFSFFILSWFVSFSSVLSCLSFLVFLPSFLHCITFTSFLWYTEVNYFCSSSIPFYFKLFSLSIKKPLWHVMSIYLSQNWDILTVKKEMKFFHVVKVTKESKEQGIMALWSKASTLDPEIRGSNLDGISQKYPKNFYLKK